MAQLASYQVSQKTVCSPWPIARCRRLIVQIFVLMPIHHPDEDAEKHEDHEDGHE
jgi:hypothetical protein